MGCDLTWTSAMKDENAPCQRVRHHAFDLRKLLKALGKLLKEATVPSLLTEPQPHTAGEHMLDDALVHEQSFHSPMEAKA
jgi:hypothetical protein